MVVEELTSPTELTTAMPDGSTQLEQWTVPVRVPREGGWVPVDTTLQREGDWYSPAASVSGVRFSAGGSGALSQTQTASGEWISETWTHGDLPAPTIEGDTATYAEVLPGVDLKLTATASGMASVYVVKSEQAARSSELSDLGVAVEGATLSTPERGLVKARAADGSSLLANQPLWWDSSGGGTFDAPGAGMPPTPVEHTVTADEVTLDVGASVDAQLKREGAVTYPIFVDPDWTPGMTASWDTDMAYPTARHLTTDPLYVGNYSKWHSDMFFRFPIGSVAGKQILKAVLSTTLTNVAACPPGPISSHYITYTSIPNPGFTWNEESAMKASGQMAWSGPMQSWTGPSTCGAKWESVGWTVTTAITTQLAASKPSVDIAFTGNNSTSRKHFAKAASLTISYNTPPSTPTGAKFSSPDRPCGTAAAPAMIGQTDVTVVVDQRDPDGGNVDVNFDLVEAANLGVVVKHTTGGLAAQGLKYGTFTGLTNGKTYAWRARGSDHLIDGVGYSPWCYFTVDTTAPEAPTLSSSASASAYKVGSPVSVSAAIATDAAGVVYWVTPGAKTATPPPVPADGVVSKTAALPQCTAPTKNVRWKCASGGGPIALSVAPVDSLSTLWVSAYDKAGNQSSASGFPLYPNGSTATPAASANLDGGHAWQLTTMSSPLPEVIPDSNPWAGSVAIGLNLPPTARKDVTDLPEPPFASPVIDTNVAFAADEPNTESAPINTSQSFTLSMWVQPTYIASTHDQVIALQYGSSSNVVQLTLTSSGKYAFCFGDYGVAVNSTSLDSNCAVGGTVLPGTWQLVTGIWDSANQQLRVLVDNSTVPAGSVSHVPSFVSASSSPLIFGPSPDSQRFLGYITNPVAVPGVVDHNQLAQLAGFFLPFS